MSAAKMLAEALERGINAAANRPDLQGPEIGYGPSAVAVDWAVVYLDCQIEFAGDDESLRDALADVRRPLWALSELIKRERIAALKAVKS